MFQRAKNFVKNHWRKAVFGGIAVQVAAYGAQYAAKQFMVYHEEKALEYWQKVKRQQFFDNIDDNCTLTFKQLFEIMKLKIGEVLDAEEVQVRLKSSQVEDKLKAWEHLKILAFTRVLVNIYGSSILCVLIRIQLSIVGGCLTKAQNRRDESSDRLEASSQTPSQRKVGDDEAQRKYLDLAHHFATTGILKICHHVREKVEAIVKPVSLKQALSPSDLEQLFWTIIRKAMTPEDVDVTTEHPGPQRTDADPTKYPWKYIFPEDLLQDHEFFAGNASQINGPVTVYRKLICDTFDLLESEDVRNILSFLECQGVSHFIDRISDSIVSIESRNSSSSSEDSTNLLEPRVAVAKLIPLMTSLHLVDVNEDPWVNLLIDAENVRVLSANIYEAFCYD